MENHPDADIVFCFDVGGTTARQALYPQYKQRRHTGEEYTQEEQEAKDDLQRQIRLLRRKYLPLIGFKNIFWQNGYECDDVIASLIKRSIRANDTVMIVSSDKDYRQLISSRVSLYSPQQGTHMGLQGFYKATGLTNPEDWARVLELAGCKTDEVPGIKGVGEATAIKFLTGELPKHTKAYKAIVNTDIIKRNRALVRLPFKGTKVFKLIRDNKVTAKSFRPVFKKLGIKHL